MGVMMRDIIYLDNAATTYPKPQSVYEYMYDFYRTQGFNPGRSGYDASLETEEIIQGTRRMLADFFGGGECKYLTFSYNASDSLNMIIQGVLKKGDHVVTTNVEHNSVLRPLHHMKHDGVIEVTYVPMDDRGIIDPGDVKKAIKKNTSLVVMNHASNVIGTVQPVKEVGEICADAGVCFAVDACQTAGVIDINVKEMHINLLAFTGHKCLMGPTGIGGSYVREDTPIRCTRFGGTGVRSAYPFHLDEFPYRMECGTLNIVGVAGLKAGLEWIKEQGADAIHGREMKLWVKLRDGLREIDGVTVYRADTPDNHISVLSFNVEGWEAADVGTMLDVDHNIACRTGLHCAPLVHRQIGTEEIHGTVRLSIGAFNTEAHIDTAIEAVREIASIKRVKKTTA